jgi:hypothetical protein
MQKKFYGTGLQESINVFKFLGGVVANHQFDILAKKREEE